VSIHAPLIQRGTSNVIDFTNDDIFVILSEESIIIDNTSYQYAHIPFERIKEVVIECLNDYQNIKNNLSYQSPNYDLINKPLIKVQKCLMGIAKEILRAHNSVQADSEDPFIHLAYSIVTSRFAVLSSPSKKLFAEYREILLKSSPISQHAEECYWEISNRTFLGTEIENLEKKNKI